MAANVSPVFTNISRDQWIGPCTAANNTVDITSGTSYLVCTADATNGSFLEELRVKVAPGNSTVASVMRVWLNNGSSIGTATNSALIGELGLSLTTTSAVFPQPDFIWSYGKRLTPGHKIYVTFGTAPGGSSSFAVTAILGDY